MGGSNVRKANGHRWRQAVALVRQRGDGCWICRAFGRPDAIDYSLASPDPMSFEVDHLVPVSRGGAMYDLDNLAATHRRCNGWRGNKSVPEVIAIAKGQSARPQVRPTAEW